MKNWLADTDDQGAHGRRRRASRRAAIGFGIEGLEGRRYLSGIGMGDPSNDDGGFVDPIVQEDSTVPSP